MYFHDIYQRFSGFYVMLENSAQIDEFNTAPVSHQMKKYALFWCVIDLNCHPKQNHTQ
jgi:hypothetical protein